MASKSSRSLGGSKSSRSLSRQPTVDPCECHAQIMKASRRVLTMDSVRSGEALFQLAREHCENFAALLRPGRELGPDRIVTIGTGCTGSAADVLVFEAMEHAYGEYVPGIRFQYKFNCEIHDKKREWIVKLHKALGQDGCVPCMFGDVTGLGASEAYCYVHDKKCLIPSVDIFLCSTSCKDLSMPESGTPQVELASRRGGS